MCISLSRCLLELLHNVHATHPTYPVSAGANFRRLAQQLEQYAAAGVRGGADVWRLQPWLRPAPASEADAEASTLIAGAKAATV